MTVQKELRTLAGMGLTESRPGVGTFVRAVRTARPADYGWQTAALRSPQAPGANLAAAQAGVHVIPVPSGPGGPDAEELDGASGETGARLFYAQPKYANPTGAQWSARAAEQVLDVVRSHGAFLVEDDWAHDFGITTSAAPVAARDDSGHVVYLRSLTKSVSPGIRVAAVIARGPARDRILADRGAESMYVSGVLQSAALDVVTQPAWQTHLRGLRHQLHAGGTFRPAAWRSMPRRPTSNTCRGEG